MNLAMPAPPFALIRNGLAVGQCYHRPRRKNRKPALTPRSPPAWAWAGWTIPQAPKERQFIAWGRKPQDPDTRQKKPFPAPAGLGSGKRKGRLGTSWGWRLQA